MDGDWHDTIVRGDVAALETRLTAAWGGAILDRAPALGATAGSTTKEA